MFTETKEVKGEQGRERGSMKEAPPACSAINVFLARAGIELADKLYSVYGDVWFSPKEKARTRCLRLASALLNLSNFHPDIIQRVSMEQDRVRHLEQHLPDSDDGDTGNVQKKDVDDFVQQLLQDPDGGDTGKVPENEAVQAPVKSAKPNTYPSNCSLEDISLMMDRNLQADTEIQRVSMEQDCVRHLEQHLLDPDDGDTGNVPEQDVADSVRNLEQLLLGPDGGDTGNVPENEAVQAPITSANPSTYPSDCSLEDQRSLMDESILEAEVKIEREEMKRDFDNFIRDLEEKGPDIRGDGSVNVSENKVSQDSNTFNCCTDEEIEACLRGLDNRPQEALDQNQINPSTLQNDTSPSNPSNVAVNQQSQVMMVTRTPTDVVASNAMALRSSLHVPLMHQVKGPQSVSNVPMHQPQSIMHQFNFQLHHHSPNPTVQLSPQVPSSVHMPLPVNQFNHQQNITPPAIPTASMPITAGSVFHWPQLDHMSPAITGLPQIPKSSPSHHAPHYATPQNHVVHPLPPITHPYNPQNLPNGVQYNPQPHHHELQPSMTSPEFYSDVRWLSNGQHLVNHQPYSDLEAPIDDHTDINKRKHWSEEEHRLFLSGMQIYGKGKWKEISINVLKTRTPGQIASHAQKFFDRLENNEENNDNDNDRARKRRRSIHDIMYLYVLAKPSHHHHQVQMNVSHQNQFVPSSSFPIHHQSYCPQNPPNINHHDFFNS